MKILLYSWAFWPSIGGVETIADTLGENIVRLGHECILVTETPSDKERSCRYKVVRRPSVKKRFELARECTLVHSNGASIAMYPFARFNNKPFIWTHNGYQVKGLYWTDGNEAFLSPLSTMKFYSKKKKMFKCFKETIKLLIHRYVANHVDLNIAATHWIASRQPLKNQVVAYTPYPLNIFKTEKIITPPQKKYDFISLLSQRLI